VDYILIPRKSIALLDGIQSRSVCVPGMFYAVEGVYLNLPNVLHRYTYDLVHRARKSEK
jgi:hypothetical protein